MTGNSAGYAAVNLNVVFKSTITGSYVSNPAGYAVFVNASSSTLSLSTFTSNSATLAALHVAAGASYNLVSQSYASNPAYQAGILDAPYNTLSRSSFTSNAADSALFVGSSSNTVTQCFVSNPAGHGLFLNAGYNSINQSTFTSSAAAYRAVFINAAYNTLYRSMASNPAGIAVEVNAASSTIVASTITSAGAGVPALNIVKNNTLVLDSYIQGATAVTVWSATATVIGGSVLVATGTDKQGLYMGGGSVGLSLSSSVLSAPSLGMGAMVDKDNSGIINFSTNVFLAGSQFSLFIATQAAGTRAFISTA
jgi:hypothetical protein